MYYIYLNSKKELKTHPLTVFISPSKLVLNKNPGLNSPPGFLEKNQLTLPGVGGAAAASCCCLANCWLTISARSRSITESEIYKCNKKRSFIKFIFEFTTCTTCKFDWWSSDILTVKQDQSDHESLLHNNLRACEFGPHLDCSLGLIVDDGEIPTARSGADSAHPGQAGQLQPELTRGSC